MGGDSKCAKDGAEVLSFVARAKDLPSVDKPIWQELREDTEEPIAPRLSGVSRAANPGLPTQVLMRRIQSQHLGVM